jgi:hypothetical protein
MSRPEICGFLFACKGDHTHRINEVCFARLVADNVIVIEWGKAI